MIAVRNVFYATIPSTPFGESIIVAPVAAYLTLNALQISLVRGLACRVN
jgi:hypothetical protein